MPDGSGIDQKIIEGLHNFRLFVFWLWDQPNGQYIEIGAAILFLLIALWLASMVESNAQRRIAGNYRQPYQQRSGRDRFEWPS